MATYEVGKVLGKGTYGCVYSAKHNVTGESVAVKVDYDKVEDSRQKSTLAHERAIYKLLDGQDGILKVKAFGTEQKHAVMVMELGSEDLENLFEFCGRKFSLKTVLMVADQVIVRMLTMHRKDVIHRDIKPNNFMMGRGEKQSTLFVMDFGAAKLVKKNVAGGKVHIPMRRTSGQLVGTARYCSVNSHRGIESSRRDDLEACMHMIIYFMLPKGLPWSGLHADTQKAKFDKIAEKKMSTSTSSLCKGLPPVFERLLTYTRELAFEVEPDYDWMRGQLAQLFSEKGFQYDFQFDWIAKQHPKFSTNVPKALGLTDFTKLIEEQSTKTKYFTKTNSLASTDTRLSVGGAPNSGARSEILSRRDPPPQIRRRRMSFQEGMADSTGHLMAPDQQRRLPSLSRSPSPPNHALIPELSPSPGTKNSSFGRQSPMSFEPTAILKGGNEEIAINRATPDRKKGLVPMGSKASGNSTDSWGSHSRTTNLSTSSTGSAVLLRQ